MYVEKDPYVNVDARSKLNVMFREELNVEQQNVKTLSDAKTIYVSQENVNELLRKTKNPQSRASSQPNSALDQIEGGTSSKSKTIKKKSAT